MTLAAVCLLWLVAGVRLALSAALPHTRWRTHLTLASTFLAAAGTLFIYREAFDSAVDVFNLAGLLSRILLIVAACHTSVFLNALRPGRQWPIFFGASIVAAVALAVAWALSPLHHQEWSNMGLLAPTPAVVAYTLGAYVYIGVFVVLLGAWCIAAMPGLLRATPPDRIGVASASCVALGCAVGLVILGGWCANALGAPDGGKVTVLFPVPLVLTLVGVAIPLIGALPTAGTLLETLLWRRLLQLAPDVRLSSPAPFSVRSRADWTAHRRGIEIRDALSRISVPAGTPRTLDDLAHALHYPSAGDGPRAVTLLSPVTHDSDDRAQILALARAYWKATPVDHDTTRLAHAHPSRAADAIAQVLHPGLLVMALMAYVAFTHTASPAAAAKWLLLAVLTVVAIPYTVLRLLHRAGVVDDLQVVRRSQRPKLFAIALTCTGGGLVLLAALGAPPHLVALIIAMLAGLGAMGLTTLVWKASMHLAVLSGTAAILLHERPLYALLPLALAPVLGWSRVRAGRHTIPQVIGGAVIGFCAAWIVYRIAT